MNTKDLFMTISTRYGEITVFANDTGALSQSLQTYGEWAQNEISFLGTLIPKGATVIDAGAYVGTHTVAFANLVGPTGRVIAIEPQRESFSLLQKNVVANALTNVQLEHAAVTDRVGSVYGRSINIDEKNSFGSAELLRSDEHDPGAFKRRSSDEALTSMRSITIDSLKLNSCALIKVDVEGLEDLAISGAEETITRLSPVIYAECNSVSRGIKTFDALMRLGYDVYVHVVDAFNEQNYLGVSSNIFGPAREAALVGVRPAQAYRLIQIERRPCELILKIDSADDLVLAMLNKPQYFGEILRAGSAARTGGAVWIEQFMDLQDQRDQAREIAHQLRLAGESALRELDRVRHMASDAQSEVQAALNDRDSALQQRDQALQQARNAQTESEAAVSRWEKALKDHDRVLHDLRVARAEREDAIRERNAAVEYANATHTQIEAAMLQARFAREAADAAEASLADLSKRNR